MIGSSSWRCGEAVAGSSLCSIFHLTALASNGVPSWNFTPERSLKTICLPSFLISQLCARSGWMEKSVPYLTSALNTK